jgi:hypothetical protein
VPHTEIVLSSLIDLVYGFLICWLLNLVQLALAFILLASSEKTLPMVYVMTIALGLVQIAYVVPLYRLLRRKAKPHVARGLVAAACITAMANLIVDYHFLGLQMLHFWR